MTASKPEWPSSRPIEFGLLSSDPSPQFLAIPAVMDQRLLGPLDDELRRIQFSVVGLLRAMMKGSAPRLLRPFKLRELVDERRT